MTDAPQYRNQRPEPWENAVVLLGVVLVCVLLLVGASGCSPRIVEHVIYQRDTTYIEKVRVDSVHKRDSVFIREKGDSVFIYREHVLECWRLVHDTITRVKVDSVAVERVREVQVEKPLPAWKRAQMRAFWPLVLLVVLLVLWTFRKTLKKLIL